MRAPRKRLAWPCRWRCWPWVEPVGAFSAGVLRQPARGARRLRASGSAWALPSAPAEPAGRCGEQTSGRSGRPGLHHPPPECRAGCRSISAASLRMPPGGAGAAVGCDAAGVRGESDSLIRRTGISLRLPSKAGGGAGWTGPTCSHLLDSQSLSRCRAPSSPRCRPARPAWGMCAAAKVSTACSVRSWWPAAAPPCSRCGTWMTRSRAISWRPTTRAAAPRCRQG